MSNVEVEIEYCVPCGFLDRALAVERAILNGLEGELDKVSLVMGSHGVFRVTVDGEAVYDKDEDDYDVDDIVRAVRASL
ncbi:SelT/SelW/SelH family protein [Haloarcula marina]|uniref:SelT/SelW/SelH family protein n=1 Tax=Haloarcula marina TaxID=2961574 RepID=UPI0020B729BC|nr:Rdx family protein [Halomicroarcula marina]